MPEIPEVSCRAKEMNDALIGYTIERIEIIQPKSLNIPESEFRDALEGAEILRVTNRGKWIFVETDKGWLLLNLGMGGEILLLPCSKLPEKRRGVFHFTHDECLSINFWWFGYVHYAPTDGLDQHQMTAKLGPNATQVGQRYLAEILSGRRGRIKSILLDQSKIAGIGNAYIHDILFLSKLHPLRAANSLSDSEIQTLQQSILKGLLPSMEKGGAFYEVNIHGQPGGFTMDDVLIGYKEGQTCPSCQDEILKIKTGSTSSFICPTCQKQ